MRTYSQRRSQKQERRAAIDVGGRVQVASGATAFAKGDVRKVGELRVECKTTSKTSFSLKLADLLKIRDEALMQGLESWVFQIEFQGAVGNHTKLAVLDALWFSDLGGNAAAKVEHKPDAASFTVAKDVAIREPFLLEWDSHKGRVAMHYCFAICRWEEFVSLYEERNS